MQASEIGQAMREQRLKIGLPLCDLAYLTGYSVPTLRRLEQGCNGSRIVTAIDIANELGLVIEVRNATAEDRG